MKSKIAWLIILIFLIFPNLAAATAEHLVISEIQTYGSAATDEFVRLYNPTGAAIDISGWRLTKKTSSGSESNLVSSFTQGTTIPVGAYFLITHKTDYKGSETANAAYSGASYSVADNNTVILKNADGAIIDKVGFGTATDYEGAPAANPENGKNIKRSGNIDTDNNKNDFAAASENVGSETPYSSPLQENPPAPTQNATNQFTESSATAENSVNASSTSRNKTASSSTAESAAIAPNSVNQTDTSSTAPKADIKKLSIIEILPNPEGADADKEYIKILYNGEADADLAGLYLDDEDGGSNPYKIPAGTIIKAEGELIFYREKTGLALNNDNDAARILDYFKKEIAAVEYEDAPESAVYVLQNGKWKWSNSVIASDSEAAPPDSVIPAASPATSPAKPLVIQERSGKLQRSGEARIRSSARSVTAVVIAPPDVFNPQTIYVDGLQLYMHNRDWPELKIGDKIVAWGEFSTYYNEPRLKLKNKSAIKIISRGNITEPMEAEGLSEDDLGRLIIIEGEVMEAGANKIILDANGEEIPIYNKTKQTIFSGIKEKDEMRIAGIVSRYKDKFRLLPRGADDIETIKSGGDTPLEKKSSFWQYIISTLAVGSLAAGICIRRRNNGKSNCSSQTLE